MDRPILNLDQVELVEQAAGERFRGWLGAIGNRIGARKLGYRLTVVPPGKRAWPFHNHHVNEEMFLVLAGTGELRLGEARHPLRAGDVVACPAGDATTAHQIVNTGTDELRYLAVSTMRYPELCEYPDSGKFGVTLPRDGDGTASFRHLDREGTGLDYWDGES